VPFLKKEFRNTTVSSIRPSWEAQASVSSKPTNYATQSTQFTQSTEWTTQSVLWTESNLETQSVLWTESNLETQSVLWTESSSLTQTNLWTESNLETQSVLWTESTLETQSVLWTESSSPTQTNLWTESNPSTQSVLWTESAQSTQPLLWTETALWTESTVSTASSSVLGRLPPKPSSYHSLEHATLPTTSTWNLMPLSSGVRPSPSPENGPDGLGNAIPHGTLSKLSTSHLTVPSTPTRRPELSQMTSASMALSPSPRFSLALPPRPSLTATKSFGPNVLLNSVPPVDGTPKFTTSQLPDSWQNSGIPKLSTSHQTIPSRPTSLPDFPKMIPQTPVSMSLTALKLKPSPFLLVLPPRPTLP
jgi:hypothetical protein